MCGRFVITSAPEAIRRLLAYEEHPNFPPRYNVAPTQPVPIVRLEEGRRHFALVRWGLIPSWVKDPRKFALLINARVEGIAEKPAFRAAMNRRRCLVPTDGFYEWQRAGKAKRPYFIRARDRRPMAFAGLWESWTDPDGGVVESMAIVTCPANALLAPIHDRMPVILPEQHFELWLATEKVKAKDAEGLLAPAPEDLLEAFEISPLVNKVANEGPQLIERVSA
jgi:putative SOS response-associated peptidase YedK